MIEIVSTPIEIDAVIAAAAAPASGATVTFIGTTREHNAGRRVRRLEYEAYEDMARAEMAKIAATCGERWPIVRVAMVHRLGVVALGEASVVIAVSAAHRADAFAACHYAIDRLKEVVPIWKKEYFEGGEVWIGAQSGPPQP